MRNARSFYVWDEMRAQRRSQQKRDVERRDERLKKKKMRVPERVSSS